MHQNQQSLLTRIIRETAAKNGKNRVSISTAGQLLELSTVTYEKTKVQKKSPRERYDRKMFFDALEDLSFFFQQYLRFSQTGGTQYEIDLAKERAAGLLEFIEEDLDNFKETLFTQLGSKDEKIQTAVVYILSSVEKDNDVSPCLNRVLAEFSKCDKGQLPNYINGLKQGKHPQLIQGLKLIKELATPTIRDACDEIPDSFANSMLLI